MSISGLGSFEKLSEVEIVREMIAADEDLFLPGF
jgi:hypothetical protein